MELGAAESVDLPSYRTIKVHRLMCLELKKLIDCISNMFSDLESARPRCTSGVHALCSVQSAMDKANLLIQHCSESSKLYLAIKAKAILVRCAKIRKTLETSMNQFQEMVPPLLAEKIAGIIDELRNARFPLEPSEFEAGTIILSLLQHGSSASKMQSEIEALRLTALRLSITSPFALLIEKRSIKKLLGRVQDTNPNKRKILNYLLYLLKKHGKLIWQLQSKNMEEESLSSLTEEEGDATSGNDFFIPTPPKQFICQLSMRLLCDPVIIASGETFERVWIETWFNDGNQTCPVTNIRLEQLSLTPNSALKDLISKWLLRHGISAPENAKPVPSLISLDQSRSSIASLGSSVLGLQLELANVSHDSVSTNSSLDSSDRKCNDETTSRPPKVAADSHSQMHQHHSSKTSSNGIHAACLYELDQRSWKSQCNAVKNVKGLLEDNDKAQHLTFSNSHVIPVINFLKDANEICDITMQKDGAEVLLAILSGSRIELPPCHEDVIYLLASLLDSETTGESLAILEILSRQSYYKSIIVASGVLPSILKLLDTTVKEFNLLALKILGNLSNGSDVGYHVTYLGYVPKLVSFLQDPNVAGYCIEIVNNIRNIGEARIEAVEAGLFSSTAMILESGSNEEQELAVELLLFLCYENTGYCQMLMTENIIQPLVNISVNGSSKGSEDASILLDLFDFVIKNDASQCSVIVSSLSEGNSNVSSSSSNSSGLRRSSYKALRYLRKKLSRFILNVLH
ncbi:Pentatricopeptide repeat-containing protein [Hibiscus syriacus]|uniref:RING-type E3 ubiquitin transferase n=1 Tax=Hibiscus syriacus TaxID=106335 RepID=A0A6A2WDA6_HIBSY|nr:U-box domain-containing protein 5-like [Hibiscus syriacus]KAE8654015.1 Pentatricopeptide repeat-containing protein [Hibiscus syriacus]